MDDTLISLIAANVTFVGSHFAMSHPLRAPLVGALGEKGFLGLYSLVSLAALLWIYYAFTAAPAADIGGSGEAGWLLATLITLPAMVLLAGSYVGNPAMPHPGAAKQAQAEPRGVFRVTRHPMMWAIALWAVSHIVLYWSVRTLITASAMGFLALVGAHLQDRKKRALMGDAWAAWEAKTSYWPRLSKLFGVGWIWSAIGIALWLSISLVHLPACGIPAGIWKWVM